MIGTAIRHASPVLTAEACEQYQTDGYSVLRGLASPTQVAALRAAVSQVAGQGRDFMQDTVLRGVKFQVQSSSGRTGETAVAPGVFRKIMYPHKLSGELRRFLTRDPAFLGALADLGMSRPDCVLDQINLKNAKVGTGFPWHQDARFLSPMTQASIANFGGVNVVLALDSANEENGTFEVLAGSHAAGPLEFDYDTGAPNDGAFDLSRRVTLPLEPGDAVFFHPYLLHGSGANVSDRPRCFLTYWFVHGTTPKNR